MRTLPVSLCLALGLFAPAGAALAAPAMDACRLLTAADVEGATKVKVGEVKADDKTSSQLGKCKYLHADKAFGRAIVASVAAVAPEKVASQKTRWTTMLKSTPVPGVAEFAYYNEAGGVLLAGRGDHAVQIQMLDGPAGPARLEAIKTLARTALAKL